MVHYSDCLDILDRFEIAYQFGMNRVNLHSIVFYLFSYKYLDMNIVSNRTQVKVGPQVFEIPTDKLSELLRLLAQWQSISVSEQYNGPTQNPKWNGQTLING
jgi:hypothetical protein